MDESKTAPEAVPMSDWCRDAQDWAKANHRSLYVAKEYAFSSTAKRIALSIEKKRRNRKCK